MSPSTQIRPAQLHDTIFIKTAKGRTEMVQRSAGLKSRQRSVLIMLDGSRSLRDLGAFAVDEVLEAAGRLLELELIAPLEAPIPAQTPTAEPVESPHALEAPQPLEPPEPPAALAEIKAMMSESARTYLGLMAADLVRRVQQAPDESALLSVVGLWHMAMRDSKYGREVADSHLARIKARFDPGYAGAIEG